MGVDNMSILDASTLFKHADNVRTQLDFISGSKHVTSEDLKKFNDLLRVIDKIYMSSNTREHRVDLKTFILFNGDFIYEKYVEISQTSLMDDCYKINI